jgi:uncharacterized protein with PQ loop repeat
MTTKGDSDTAYDYVGLVAVLFSSSSVIPQVWKIYTEGTTRSFSILYTSFLLVSSICWMIYHTHYKTYYGVLTGAIWAIFSLYITIMILVERRGKKVKKFEVV